jgi:hypothetical protein
MYSVSDIKTLKGLVGWNQPANPEYAILNAGNLESRSGIKIDEVSSYAKIEYVKDSQDYSGISDVNFNSYLDRLQESAVVQVVSDVFDMPDSMESKPLFSDNPDTFTQLDNDGDFVGFEINLARRADISAVINKAWLYFDGVGDIELLLFNQFSKDPVQRKTISLDDSGIKDVQLGWELPFSNGRLRGKWYIGYLTGVLTPNALDGNRCYNSYRFIDVCAGKVPGWNQDSVFGVSDFDGTGHDYGLNFDITIKKDVTATILNNEQSFASAIGFQYAIKCLQLYSSSLRSNINERYSKDFLNKALFELEGNSEQKIYGLKSKYYKSIKQLQKSFTCIGNKIHIKTIT